MWAPTKQAMRKISFLLLMAVGLAACGSDEIDSDEEARRAYLGLDKSIQKSLKLGFDGFNAASSANISPQMVTGIKAGTLVITGQVDQGSSDNKGMRLNVGMVGYTDGPLSVEYDGETIEVDLTFDTSTDVAMQPYLQLSLRNIPTGTFTGTLMGTYTMHGDIEGEATLNLMFSGTLMADPAAPSDPTNTVRVPGSTTVTGTAVSGDGTYMVNITI
jgi:hypothetical protein